MGQALAALCGNAKDPEDDVVGVSILFRHGARFPNKAELDAFSSTNAVRTQWHTESCDALYPHRRPRTDRGRRRGRDPDRFKL